jgi:hypothetical protein
MPAHVIEWSKGRPRSTLRLDEGTPLPSEDAAPMKDAVTGRFLKGNRAHRRRQLKARAEGISTTNPAKAPTWLRPFIEMGASYTVSLLAMLEGKPALFPLAGDISDAHALYRGLLSLALETTDAKERASLLSEARGWLREHRTALATLSALAGDIKVPSPDPHAELRRIATEEQEAKRTR